VIADGLQPGERIVVEGFQKVKDGMTVKPKLVSMETPTAQQAESPESQLRRRGGKCPSQATNRGNQPW